MSVLLSEISLNPEHAAVNTSFERRAYHKSTPLLPERNPSEAPAGQDVNRVTVRHFSTGQAAMPAQNLCAGRSPRTLAVAKLAVMGRCGNQVHQLSSGARISTNTTRLREGRHQKLRRN